ncbi:carbohydrate binding domain-containing protein [Ruminococcus sp. HUN007]|uniref:carbohydrate binding domain-containing protein n=1 Tax=Ruminococcus sp. HUN007 TaxID=1514668 RepID=UPI0018CC0F6D|nr:carbohydrate binding domain-containing protein [Ruminococcus sp. HUN007]
MKHENIKKKNFPATAFLIALTFFFMFAGSLCTAVSAEPSEDESSVVAAYDFENENALDEWFPIVGRIRMQIDHEKTYSGSGALKVDDRETCFDGPAADITDCIRLGTEYHISFKCMYDGKEDDYIRMSVRKTFSDSGERYENVHWIRDIKKNEWVSGEADLLLSENVEKLDIYFESGNRESTIWLDDIIITEKNSGDIISAPQLKPEGTTLYDFENGVDPGFKAVRDASIIRSGTASFKGEHSLSVCCRKDSRDGVALDISALKKNVPYRCSTQILFAASHISKEYFSIYLQYHTSETSYTDIAVIPSHETSSGSWSSLGGIFTVPEGAVDPVLYITSVKPKDELKYKHVDFFIDDFVITDSLETYADRIMLRKRTKMIIGAVILAVLFTASAIILLISRKRMRRRLNEAAKDSMTGAYNRNAYEQLINQLVLKPEKCRKLFFAVCDVNGLKYLNDNYGHQTGDQCIIKCVHLLLDVMNRHSGKVYRTGGDEFVCTASQDFKADLKQTLENEENSFKDYPFAVAVGTASYSPYEDGEKPDVKEIISRCDKEMYIDKKRKQNKKIQY